MSAIVGKPADTLIGRPFGKVVEEVFGLTELRPLRDIARVRSRTSTEIMLDDQS